MANKKVSATAAQAAESAPVAPVKAKKEAGPAEYTAKELVAATSTVFPGKARDVVAAALRMAGKEKFTKAEAQKLVADFASRPIKTKKGGK